MIEAGITEKLAADLKSIAASLLQGPSEQENVNLADRLSKIAVDFEKLVLRYEVPEIVRSQLGQEDSHLNDPRIFDG